MRRAFLFMLLFAPLSFPASQLGSINEGAGGLCAALACLLPTVAMVMAVSSAIVYAAGQFFGAETRAKVVVWATAGLAGSLIAILIAYIGPVFLNALYGSTIECKCSGVTGAPVQQCTVNVGDPCSSDVDCCSGGFCDKTSGSGACICKATGAACISSIECCGSVVCTNNVCGGKPCKPDGSTCSINGDCCQGSFCDKSGGSGVCAPLITCRQLGYTCLQTFECCNASTNPLVNCVSQVCTLCSQNGAIGCMSGGITCCSGICAADTCVASCNQDGWYGCAANPDCCMGNCNLNGYCGNFAAVGAPCKSPPNCAPSDICYKGFCHAACSTKGSLCSQDTDCCDYPLDICDRNPVTGKDECMPCYAKGAACNSLASKCCAGLTCPASATCTGPCTGHMLTGCSAHSDCCDYPADRCLSGKCDYCIVQGAGTCSSAADCCDPNDICNSFGNCAPCGNLNDPCGQNGDCCSSSCNTIKGLCK